MKILLSVILLLSSYAFADADDSRNYSDKVTCQDMELKYDGLVDIYTAKAIAKFKDPQTGDLRWEVLDENQFRVSTSDGKTFQVVMAVLGKNHKPYLLPYINCSHN